MDQSSIHTDSWKITVKHEERISTLYKKNPSKRSSKLLETGKPTPDSLYLDSKVIVLCVISLLQHVSPKGSYMPDNDKAFHLNFPSSTKISFISTSID